MPSEEDFQGQLKLLAEYRSTLAICLQQQAKLGSAHTPPGIINNIREAREQIKQIKDILRNWNVPVENHPNDEESTSPILDQRLLLGSLSIKGSFLVLTVVGLTILVSFIFAIRPAPSIPSPTATVKRNWSSLFPTENVPTPVNYLPKDGDPIRVVISKIGVDRLVFPVGLDKDRVPFVPEYEVGWYIYSARPGEGGNIVFWAKIFRFRDQPKRPAPFEDLDKLEINDRIFVVTQNKTFIYRVVSKIAANQEQIEYILPTGKEQVTLVGGVGSIMPVESDRIDRAEKLIIVAYPAES